ncbi:hypothetical protein UFOVP1309_10 [uncultured Caudovirales phage]|uniref:Uncharacterized protein n=1 Tax=uncultured Caudovirales phage TaxID=2100421 RepID=A0A6J5RUZ7_9CAUD|nr:hypothetical protein UFOVP1309_10 [uncultured Caudovirales phage]
MSGHTSGPWVGMDNAGKFNGNHEWSAEHESATSSTSAPIWAGNKVIALVVSTSNRISFDETELEANARLIAAAPELLEALSAIVEYWDSIVPLECINDHHKAAIAAIAKATCQ